MNVQLREIGPDDPISVETLVAIDNACLVDAPWSHPHTVHLQTMMMKNGWDGEPGRHFLVYADAVEEPVGRAALYTSEYDNLDSAWVDLAIHPEHRRRGYGTAGMRAVFDLARDLGRTKIGWFGWVGERTSGFASSLGFEPKSVAVCRRQYLEKLEPGLAEELYAEAAPYATDYELVRIVVPTPDDLLPALAEATAAINDAPLDGLQLEDEVFTSERIKAYETAQLANGSRVYRIIACRRGTGEIAGLTVVALNSETPSWGHQHDTSVVRTHRGHRLGQLLKADMMRWLAEVEPQVETLDTFNAESNDHMIAVNERLGYTVMDRELQFQGLLETR